MVVVWNAAGSNELPAKAISKLDLSKVTAEAIGAAAHWVMAEFDKAGAEDRTAKDEPFTQRLIENWQKPAVLDAT